MAKDITIHGIYHIPDCENRGDIHRAIAMLLDTHPKIRIVNHYWDKHDCGEAYVAFAFPSQYFVEIYNKVDADYNADINNYISIEKENSNIFANAKICKPKEFSYLCNKHKCLFDAQNITLTLFFQESKKLSNEAIVKKAIYVLGLGTKIVAYEKSMTDGYRYVTVLLQTPIVNVSFEKLHSFGDYCLGRHGWLKENNIYGEIRVNSILKDYCKYNDFVGLIQKIANKEPLLYTNKAYYYPKVIEVQYDTYINKDNSIKERFEVNGQFFYIKTD